MTKKLCIGFILLFTFTLLFNQIFHLAKTLYFVFPEGAFHYPRPKTVNNEYVFFLKILLSWGIPLVLSLFFIIKSALLSRLTKNWGLTLLIITVVIYLARYGLLYGSTFIPGGGPTFMLAALFSYLNLPLKIMLVTSVLKVLFSLENPDDVELFSEKAGGIVLTLGLGLLFSLLFDELLRSGVIGRFRFALGFYAFFVIYLVLASVVVYTAKLHKRISDHYSIYVLLGGIIFNLFTLFIPFHRLLPSVFYTVMIALSNFILVAGFLGVCLNLKPHPLREHHD